MLRAPYPGRSTKLTFPNVIVAIGVVLLTSSSSAQSTSDAGALSVELPPDRTLLTFNLNLKSSSVPDGGIAVTVIKLPTETEEDDTVIVQLD